MPPRITQIADPVVVGRYYMVPTVRYPYLYGDGIVMDWPVFLPKHDDAEFFDFHMPHYHIDPRFLSARTAERIARKDWQGRMLGCYDGEARFERKVQSTPLGRYDIPGDVAYPGGGLVHPPVVWKRLLCRRDHVNYRYGLAPQVQKLREAFAGRQCVSSEGGWLCPHQNYAMGSVTPDEDGMLTCPLHGLRIDPKTGMTAPKEPTP